MSSSASRPRSMRSPMRKKRSNSVERSPTGGALRREIGRADWASPAVWVLSQVRTRPGRDRSGNTLDARPFIVDALGGQATTRSLRNVYTHRRNQGVVGDPRANRVGAGEQPATER